MIWMGVMEQLWGLGITIVYKPQCRDRVFLTGPPYRMSYEGAYFALILSQWLMF